MPSLNVELATLAREESVQWFTIGSDAHSAPELELLTVRHGYRGARGIPRANASSTTGPLGFVRLCGHHEHA